jgi:hypothetical protein
MTQGEPNADRQEGLSQANLLPPEFVTMGKKRIKALAEMQTELFEKLQEANRSWLDRMQVEASLVSEFGTKLTGAHSIPETIATCQEWASRRMEMATEDARHVLADTQTFTETGVRLLSSGWLPEGPGGSK